MVYKPSVLNRPRVELNKRHRGPNRFGKQTLAETEAKLRMYVRANPYASVEDMVSRMSVPRSSSQLILKQLTEAGVIKRTTGKTRRYFFPDQETKKATDLPIGAEVDDCELILQYISDHDGESYFKNKMARDLNMPYPKLIYELGKLVKRGLIDNNFNNSVPESAAKKLEEPTTPEPAKKNEFTQRDIIETLAWEYIRANRNSDLFSFLNWLDERVK